MVKRAWSKWGLPALLLLVAFLGGQWWWQAQRARDEFTGPVTKGGVTLEKLSLDRMPSGERGRVPQLGGAPGDWLLSSAQVSVAVGAGGASAERALRFGAVLDASGRDVAADRIEELRPVLYVDGRRVDLETRSVVPDLDGPVPALVVTQSSPWGVMDVVTRISVDPQRPWVHLRSVVENRRSAPLRLVRLGDRVRWPGGPPFVPGMGFVSEATVGRASWIGRTTPKLAYALAYLGGEMEIELRTDRVGPSEQVTLASPATLATGESAVLERTLVLAPGGLAHAGRDVLELQKEPFGIIEGRVEPATVERASIELREAGGGVVMVAEPFADNSFELAAPPGRYDVTLHAPGGRHVESVVVDPDEPALVRLLAPRAGTLWVSVVDTEGVPMPARVSLYGIHPTPKPHFGSAPRAEGTHNIAYTEDGEVTLELPPGRYAVRVTRGPEYAIHRSEVEIAADRGQALRVSLERLVHTKGWISGDFHLHSDPSPDSSVTLDDRVRSLVGEGVEVAVATDHNHVTDFGPAVKAQRLTSALLPVVGVEITTVGWGHFNAFPYPRDARPPQYAGVVPWEIFADARELAPRAVIQVNHPRMAGGIGYFARLRVGEEVPPEAEEGFSFDFDTLEVVNGFELDQPSTIEQNIQEWFALLDWGYTYTAVGNSDSHGLAFQWAGYPRTYVKVAEDRPELVTEDELASALLKGRAQISNGIFAEVLVAGEAGPGDMVSTSTGEVLLEVAARAAPWVDVSRAEAWVNGQLAAKTALQPLSRHQLVYGWRQALQLEEDSWIVVIVRGDRPLRETFPEGKGTPFAIVNPVFVDVDGDGRFRARLAPAPPEADPELDEDEAAAGAPGERP